MAVVAEADIRDGYSLDKDLREQENSFSMHLLFARRVVIPLIETMLLFQSTGLRKRVKLKLWLVKQRSSPATPLLLLGFVFRFRH